MIIGIVAVDRNWGIGKDGDLLFHIKEDMKYFKEHTLYHPVFMGRKTLESFPNGKPLKDRSNVVLCSRDRIYNGCYNIHSLDEFISFAKQLSKIEDVYIIGGGSIYKEMLPYYDKVLVTLVHADKEADTYFPNLDKEPFTKKRLSGIINTEKYPIQFFEYRRNKDED